MESGRVTAVQKFWAHVDRSAGPGACWEWTGTRDRRGKCTMAFGPRREAVHRIAYRVTSGPIPPGMLVMHTCWNSLCCNPAHLMLGTPADLAASRGRRTVADREGG